MDVLQMVEKEGMEGMEREGKRRKCVKVSKGKGQKTKEEDKGEDRCQGFRSNGEPCMRKRKGNEYCALHEKEEKKIEVFVQDIQGILYYMDKEGNIYDTEQVIKNIPNPAILKRTHVAHNH